MNTGNLRQYLLGRRLPAEREEIENRVFTEDGFDELLQEAEADLLDDWARGRLAAEDAKQVRLRFDEQKRALALALARLPRQRRKSAWIGWIAAAAAALALAGVYWVSQRTVSSPPVGTAVQKEIPAREPQVQVVALHVTSTRGARIPVFRVPPSVAVIRFEVPEIPGRGAGGYLLRLEPAAGGPSIPPAAATRVAGKVYTEQPEAVIPTGDYDLLVYANTGAKLLASYSFRIERQ